MRQAELLRTDTGPEGTFGRLQLLDDDRISVASWLSLELPWADNLPQHSCIPAGAYRCSLQATSKWSPREDGRLYQVLNVGGRSQIKIHAATWAGDERAGWKAELLGCIALGHRRWRLAPAATGKMQACILESRNALAQFMEALADEPFMLAVRWAEGIPMTAVA